jgi:SAM-dependent methyltransferase
MWCYTTAMQNVARWRPTKFVVRDGKLRATRDASELAASSRLVADLVAEFYGRAFATHARGRLLDMGCGKAPFFEAYRSHVSTVECIDWVQGPHGSDYLDQACDLTGTIPYADGSFDTILLSDVLEHLPEPMNCWLEMNRLLDTGGKVLLNVPFYYQIHEAPHDYYRYTEFALKRFAEASGFKVEELTSIGGALEVLADLTAKLLAGVKLAPLAIAIQAMARGFGRTSLGSRIASFTGRRFPLGYVMVAVKERDKRLHPKLA